MDSRERVLLALRHKEADRVPFDLGGTVVTGISVKAYRALRRYLGLPEIETTLVDVVQQIATVDDDVMEKLGVDVKNFFHSCGAMRAVIPDLIEIGCDILNPVQVSAAGMDSAELKREYGKGLTFWGGGVDTQRVLGAGTPQQVREDVKRRLIDLMPGGGFVFNTVHNIQGDVPVENIIAMWETVQEYGRYS